MSEGFSPESGNTESGDDREEIASYEVRELPAIDRMTHEQLSRLLRQLVPDSSSVADARAARAEWGAVLAEEQQRGKTHMMVESTGRASVLLTVLYDSHGAHVQRCRSLTGDAARPDYPAIFDYLLSRLWDSAPAVTVETGEDSALRADLIRDSAFAPVATRIVFSRPDHAGADRACGAVVYRGTERGVEYLLIRQHDGAWGFPKGHMDPGEREGQTALREIAEETGIRVTIEHGFRRLVTYVIPEGRRKWVTYFLARAAAGATVSRQAAEIAEFAWLPYSEALERVSFSNTCEVLEQADRFRRFRDHTL